jgi:hypothetical protein
MLTDGWTDRQPKLRAYFCNFSLSIRHRPELKIIPGFKSRAWTPAEGRTRHLLLPISKLKGRKYTKQQYEELNRFKYITTIGNIIFK